MALDDFDTHETSEGQTAARPIQTPPAQPLTRSPVARPSATVPAPKSLHPDDEDLFDFPLVEMKLEASAPVAVQAPASAVKKPVAPVAIKPVVPVVPVAAVAPPSPAKVAAVEPKPQEKQDIAQAAQIVEDLEHLLGEGDEPRAPERRFQLRSPLALAGVAALVLTNVLGLFLFWRTAQTYQSGVQAMNEKLAETLRRQSDAQGQASAVAPQPANTDAPRPPAVLEAFELSTLRVARDEIQAGEYADARRRLARLLAVADRIEVDARADIEAQAAFLIASSYRKQAELAREKSP